MTIFRVEHNKNYTVINNTICKDSRLSWKAKGIWLYAYSRPDDWEFHLNDLVKQSTDGKSSVKAGLKELEKFGYLKRIMLRDRGKFSKADWQFYETPQVKEDALKKKVPQTDFRSAVFRSAENQPLLNTELLPSTESTTTRHGKIKVNRPTPSGSSISLEKLKLKDSMKQKLVKENSEENLSIAVDRVLKWIGRKSDEAAILTVLNNFDTWNDVKSEEEESAETLEFVEKMLKPNDGKTIANTRIDLMKSEIHFIRGNICQVFKFIEKGFIKKVTDYIQELIRIAGNQRKFA